MNRAEKWVAEHHRLRVRWYESLAAIVGSLLALVVLLTWVAWHIGFEAGQVVGEDNCRVVMNSAAQAQTDERAKGKHHAN